MKILFVVCDLFYSEPLGVMALSAVCKRHGHETALTALRREPVEAALERFQPDVVAYSTMSPDERTFIDGHQRVRAWAERHGRRIRCVMGGPHPTFFPEVLERMDLDAICIGEGDRAIIGLLESYARGEEPVDVPNIATRAHPEPLKEMVDDLDTLEPVDRDLFYAAAPELRQIGIRSFLTQKGCPYKCTYCFNHAYNKMFKGEGRKLFRRRSVESVMAEIKRVVAEYPTVRMIRFADDVFAWRVDGWLTEFTRRYREEVGIPFYCLIRPDGLTEEMAQLLSEAGCHSIGMSVEAGVEEVRNQVLKRNMPDELMRRAFGLANRYGLRTFSNTILGIPGTTLAQDLESVLFSRELAPAAPTFSVFCPYPKTELTQYAIEIGALNSGFDFNSVYSTTESILTNYTREEKKQQLHLSYLGGLFCKMPDFMLPLLRVMIRWNATRLFNLVGSLYYSYIVASRIFPYAQPRNPVQIAKNVFRVIKFLMIPRKAT